MNSEKIREPAERADQETGLIKSFDYWKETYSQKFAELIVKECAQVVNDNDFVGSTIGNRLLFKHFGLE